MTVLEQARQAKQAAIRLVSVSHETRNQALHNIGARLDRDRAAILAANRADLQDAGNHGIGDSLLARLNLSDGKIDGMIDGIRDLVGLQDPIGVEVSRMELDTGLTLTRVTVALGLIGVVFESRPDALVQIGSLCVKSGNAVVMKGGSEARRTNETLFSLIRGALEATHADFRGSLQLVETRRQIEELLALDDLVDLMIPRGSSELVRHIKENTRIPVLGHAEGVCHLYIDDEADIAMALELAYDAKCQYPAVCNAIETLLVHESLAEEILPRLKVSLTGVELRGDERSRSIVDMNPATEDDWRKEYNDLILSVRVVASLEEAVDHINCFGSRHTDAIVTSSRPKAERFMNRVDSSSVMWNCSTRFADGYRYGLGAEVGIATGKIHARGPVGLEGLTTYKYKLVGNGTIVAPYADGTKKFSHRKL